MDVGEVQEQARTGSVTPRTPRTGSTPASGKGSPDITRYDYPKAGARTASGKTWGLPPPQLSNVHLHSQALRPAFAFDQGTNTIDDLDESVGSISGGNRRGYDDYDSGDEQESGLYSPDTSRSDTSPSGGTAGHLPERDELDLHDARRPVIPDPEEVEDYYDGPLSRKSSFGKKEGLRRDVSGRRDSSGRKDDNCSAGKKDSFDNESGLSRKNSLDMCDTRHGAYTGSGRFDPYYGRREDPAERHGAYTGSGKCDLAHGRFGVNAGKDSGDAELSEEQRLSSATELSDSADDDDSDGDQLQTRPVKPQCVGYPKIEAYEQATVSVIIL